MEFMLPCDMLFNSDLFLLKLFSVLRSDHLSLVALGNEEDLLTG